MCLPAAQASIITKALGRYEKLKPAYVAKAQANLAWRMVHAQDSVALEGKNKLIKWWSDSYAEEQALRQDSDHKAALWRKKATKRGIIIGVGVALPVLYGGHRLVRAVQ